MLVLLCSWVVIAFVFLSFGDLLVLAWSKLTKSDENKYSCIDKLWMGMCGIAVTLSILSIFSPINFFVLIAYISLSILLFIIRRKSWRDKWSEFLIALKASISKKYFILYGLALVAVLLYALTTPLLFDVGLYHLQTMMWAEEYSIIPGLGNLHGRLAFNSNFLLLSTLFNYHPDYYTTYFTINSLALLVFSFWAINLVMKSESVIKSLVVAAILIFSIFSYGMYLSSSSTDILSHLLASYLLIQLAINSNQILREKSLLYVLIPIFCVTLKLSSAVLVLLTLAVFVILLKGKEYKKISILVVCGLIIGVPWIIRFVILSGYLVYPFEAIDLFSFDWKISPELVKLEKDVVFTWAVNPDLDPSDILNMSVTNWIPIWLKRQSLFKLILWGLVFFSPIVLLLSVKKTKHNLNILLAWSVAFASCLFGFFTGPDIRFNMGVVLCCAFLPYLLFQTKRLNETQKILYQMPSLAMMVALVGIISIAYNQVRFCQLPEESKLDLIVSPQPIRGTNANFNEYKVSNQLFFYPEGTIQCFDHCLPCMPMRDNKIEPRGNKIEDGFRRKKN